MRPASALLPGLLAASLVLPASGAAAQGAPPLRTVAFTMRLTMSSLKIV
jgi:hypothetical protein